MKESQRFTNLTLLKPVRLKLLPISSILRTWTSNLSHENSEPSFFQKTASKSTLIRIFQRPGFRFIKTQGGAWEQCSLRWKGLLRKEGPPTYSISSQNFSIVAIYKLFKRLSWSFQQKSSCFRRVFNESQLSFAVLSTKVILLSESFQQKYNIFLQLTVVLIFCSSTSIIYNNKISIFFTWTLKTKYLSQKNCKYTLSESVQGFCCAKSQHATL